MYCVAIGDIFITQEMMHAAVEKHRNIINSCKYFFWGTQNRKEMRDTVKIIENGGRDKFELPEEIIKEIEKAEILMIHLCPITNRVLERAQNLKVILCNRGGVENVDVDAATDRRIAVITNPAHNANAVAEYTIGLILCETRNIVRSNIGLKNNEWREKYPNSTGITELKDLTIGIVGFGNVGELVCEKLSGFNCRMLISNLYKPEFTNPRINWENVEYVELNELIDRSDIISLHARDSKKKVLFGEKEFERMKSTAYFINTSRSYMVDYEALYNALLKQEIRGAAVDVFETEPLSRTEPLLTLDNITLTNHRGGDTINAYADSPEMMLKELEQYISNQKVKFWINPSVREMR